MASAPTSADLRNATRTCTPMAGAEPTRTAGTRRPGPPGNEPPLNTSSGVKPACKRPGSEGQSLQQRWTIMATKTKKCANPTCSCDAPPGSKFCSAHCESTAGRTELACLCGHHGCQGDLRS